MPLSPRYRLAMVEVTRAQSLRDVARALAVFGEPYGLNRLFIAELVLGYSRPELVVFIDTMGKAWRRLYAEHGIEMDPMLNLMREERGAVQWWELVRKTTDPKQREYLLAFRDIGLIDGVSVPIWGSNGYWAWVAAASDRPLDLSHEDREGIQLLAMVTVTKCRLLRYGVQAPSDHELSVSHREADILYWVLEGKTDDEIGIILGLGKTTVKFHIRNAMAKLDAGNRITAAVKALKSGLLLGPLARHAVLIPPPGVGPRH